MLNKYLCLLVLVVLAAGCGVKAQTYVMTKERVDQSQSGNGGCLSGECAEAEASDKKTRKVYILEVTKPLAEAQVKKIELEVQSSSSTKVPQEEAFQEEVEVPVVAAKKKRMVMVTSEGNDAPAVEEVAIAVTTESGEVAFQGPTTDQIYTVLKDDTLQKIAKKFYGSFGKWYRIYEANKEAIKDPNLVKPGTVITIPAVK